MIFVFVAIATLFFNSCHSEEKKNLIKTYNKASYRLANVYKNYDEVCRTIEKYDTTAIPSMGVYYALQNVKKEKGRLLNEILELQVIRTKACLYLVNYHVSEKRLKYEFQYSDKAVADSYEKYYKPHKN